MVQGVERCIGGRFPVSHRERYAIESEYGPRKWHLKRDTAGIAGFVASSGESLNIVDAYKDDRFSSVLDRQSNYQTRTILCIPVCTDRGFGVRPSPNSGPCRFAISKENLSPSFSASTNTACYAIRFPAWNTRCSSRTAISRSCRSGAMCAPHYESGTVVMLAMVDICPGSRQCTAAEGAGELLPAGNGHGRQQVAYEGLHPAVYRRWQQRLQTVIAICETGVDELLTGPVQTYGTYVRSNDAGDRMAGHFGEGRSQRALRLDV